MRIRYPVLLLFVPLLMAAQQAPPAVELKEFSSKEGGFTVLLPGTPSASVQKSKDLVNHIFVLDRKPTAYLVAYLIDSKLSKAGADDIARTLEKARKSVEVGFKGKLLSEKKITLDKHPGIEFQLEAPAAGIYRSRAFVANDRLYQVTVLGPKDVVTSAEADKILDSFKLTP
jgi:hypothetical protein